MDREHRDFAQIRCALTDDLRDRVGRGYCRDDLERLVTEAMLDAEYYDHPAILRAAHAAFVAKGW